MIPLIVIDTKTDRCAALGNLLAGTGTYRVITSASPDAALAGNLGTAPGAVIVVQEEGQDGLAFIGELREKKIEIPAIVLAAAYEPEAFRHSVQRPGQCHASSR